MTRSKAPVLAVLGVALLGLVGWGLYLGIEFYEETEESGWSARALRNPFLAAQLFMEESGVEVTEVDSLVKLDQFDDLDTLFFSDANQIQSPRQLEQLLDWLERGGNVIYSANDVEHEDDLLLREFGVEVDWRDREEGEAWKDQTLSESLREYNRRIERGMTREEIAADIAEPDAPLTSISFADDIGDLSVAFNTDRVLLHDYINEEESNDRHQPFSWSSSTHGVHMMQFEIGEGLLTLVSDPGIWTSYQIDSHDHAYLLWLLSSQDGNFGMLRAVLRDSIWTLMLRYAFELLLVCALLILLLLWRLSIRFGRLLPRDLSRRRALGEHFSSVSLYLWQRRRSAYLLEPLRQAVIRRASLVLRDFAVVEPAQQYQLIARRCDIPERTVNHAFTNNDFNEAGFVKTVRLLKHIEQSL